LSIIAVEEAFVTAELLDIWTEILEQGIESHGDPAFDSIYSPILKLAQTQELRNKLLDVDKTRLADMDKNGVAVQLLSVTAPGVQIFDSEAARSFTIHTNDYLSDIVAKHPTRFYGLITVSPSDPNFSAQELERMAGKENMVGIIINSHTNGKYLDDEFYFPIFAKAEELDLPIYLHPSTPNPNMVEPLLKYGLEGPMWGFAADTGLHALRLILSGVFDRFPNLQMVLGHMGEGLPYWLHRLDSRLPLSQMLDKTGRLQELKKLPSEYFKSNLHISTSGMNWSPVLRFVCDVIGVDRVMFAIDYPYESSEPAVLGLKESKLTDEEKRQIFELNAQRLFNIST